MPTHSARLRPAAALPFAAALALALAALLLVLPAAVPDTSSPRAANATGALYEWRRAGQTIVPQRDGLDSISLILATGLRSDRGEIVLEVRESAEGPVLRRATRSLADLPEGDARWYHAGGLSERWQRFTFEPIPDSAGRTLYLSVDARDVPLQHAANVLMFYHSGYPQGQAYLDGQPVDAHLVFRATSRGRLADLPAALLPNLLAGRPGPLAHPAAFAAIGAAYLGAIGLLIVLVQRSGRGTEPRRHEEHEGR